MITLHTNEGFVTATALPRRHLSPGPLARAVCAVVEPLEERRLLAAETFPITWDQWEHFSPTFFAQLAVAEQKYPQFAQELNAELAQLQAESLGTSSASAAAAPAIAARRRSCRAGGITLRLPGRPPSATQNNMPTSCRAPRFVSPTCLIRAAGTTPDR